MGSGTGVAVLVSPGTPAYRSRMRFSEDSLAVNTIRACRDGEIVLNDTIITRSVLITPDLVQDWTLRSIDELTTAHLEQLAGLQPEIVILGTGIRLRFPPVHISATLQMQGIGVEVMANDAACRTFNILLAEDRRVVVAIILDNPDISPASGSSSDRPT